MASPLSIWQEPAREDVLRIWTDMREERRLWWTHWRDAVDYVVPWTGRYLRGAMARADPKYRGPQATDESAIVDSIASRCVTTAASGIHSSLTNPARPWFRITTASPRVADIAAIKRYLFDIQRLLEWVFARSNIYAALHTAYRDMFTLGTSPIYVDEDDRDIIRAYVIPIGQYGLLNDDRQRIDSCGREFTFTVRNLVRRFGQERLCAKTRLMVERKQWNQRVSVLHLVVPNEDLRPAKIGVASKRFLSVWTELSAEKNEPHLQVRGYRQFPVMAGRWEVTGTEDVYGHCPVREVMPDIKQLQHIDERKIRLIDKILSPPTMGPQGADAPSLLAGANNYLPAGSGQKVETLYVPDRYAISEARQSVAELEYRVRSTLREDLWRMLIERNAEDIQGPEGRRPPGMTATEVAARQQEKLILLGPFVDRVHNEVLSPLIRRVLDILLERGDLPPPPREFRDALLAGEDVRIEYISVLAQAQRLLGLGSMERFASIVSVLAGGDPNHPVWDKLDRDEFADQTADQLGIPPSVVRSDEDVAMIRLARAQKEQRAQEAQNQMALATARARNAQAAPVAPTAPAPVAPLLSAFGPTAVAGMPGGAEA